MSRMASAVGTPPSERPSPAVTRVGVTTLSAKSLPLERGRLGAERVIRRGQGDAPQGGRSGLRPRAGASRPGNRR